MWFVHALRVAVNCYTKAFECGFSEIKPKAHGDRTAVRGLNAPRVGTDHEAEVVARAFGIDMKVQMTTVVVAAAAAADGPGIGLSSWEELWRMAISWKAVVLLGFDPDLCSSLTDEDQNAASILGLAGRKVYAHQRVSLQSDWLEGPVVEKGLRER